MTQLQAIPLLLGSLGFQELLLIFLIVLVIFGSTKLPALGRGLGEGIRNFKRGIKSDEPARARRAPRRRQGRLIAAPRTARAPRRDESSRPVRRSRISPV